MPETSSNGHVANNVITLSNTVNAEVQLEVARLSINPGPVPAPSASKPSRRVRGTTSSGSKSKVGAVAAYPTLGAPSELGEIPAPVAPGPVGRTTRSRKKAAN